MPIILAIEPDQRQAAHLAGVVRQKVQAELILADTTEGALDAIGDRVPDMVLVPALLSPQDDAALAAALRVIAAAAHVRTLTIPVLANGTKRTKPGGMLAKWRRGRAESPAPDGCDPSVFADQINAYLHEVAAERAALEPELSDDAQIETVPLQATQPIETAQTELIELAPIAFAAPDPIELAPPAQAEPFVVEPIGAWTAEPTDLSFTIEPIEQLMAAAFVEPESPAESGAPSEADTDGQPDIDLSDELEDLADKSPEGALFAGMPVGVHTIWSAVEEHVAEELVVEAPVVAESVVEEHLVEQPLVEEYVVEDMPAEAETPRSDIEPWVPMYLTPGRMWPPLEGVFAQATTLEEFQAHPEHEPIAAFVQAEVAPREARPEPRPEVRPEPRPETRPEPRPEARPATPTRRADHPEWLELVASLRHDIERRRSEPAPIPAPPITARSVNAGDAKGNRRVKKQKPFGTKAKPLQDEWGFFDPKQCGFSALLAKLEEITGPSEESDAR